MRKIFLLIVALVIVNNTFSQAKFGIKAGFNFASVSNVKVSASGMSMDIYEKEGMSVGFNTGVFANISLGDIIGFQPELLFSLQGGKQKLNSLLADAAGMPAGAKISYQFGYIQLPLLLEIKPVENLGILAGPQLGFNISKKATATYGGESETISGSEFNDEYGDGFKSFDAGLILGLQYTIQKVTIGARYNFGLTNSLDFSETFDGVRGSAKGWKNSVFQLGVGLLF